MKHTRSVVVYSLLFVSLIVVVLWQLLEHRRVSETLKLSFLDRAYDISTTFDSMLRSNFVSFIDREMFEKSFTDLIETRPVVLSLALLNPKEEVIASAGDLTEFEFGATPLIRPIWHKGTVLIPYLLELPAGITSGTISAFVIERDKEPPDGREMRPPNGPPDETRREREVRSTNEPTSASQRTRGGRPPNEPPDENAQGGPNRPPNRGRGGPPEGFRGGDPGGPGGPGGPSEGGRRRDFWRRPAEMTREQWEANIRNRFIQRMESEHSDQGVRKLALRMSTQRVEDAVAGDAQLRLVVVAIAFVAILGLSVGWRGVERATALQLRLIRAREMNAHLREKNIAAAGLAHETRNPLNIVRGLAQMIYKDKEQANPEKTHENAGKLIEEVDRVTCRLNEFIDYSKPREASLTPTRLASIISDVERMLESDREDKAIEFSVEAEDLVIEADESHARQVIFNLLLNAIQAVDHGGKVRITLKRDKAGEAWLEVSDNGPGVPVESREEIFRPYFTLNKEGTGLGLAIVWQIIRTHHWDIQYLPSDLGGATFRITGLKISKKAVQS